MAHAFTLLSLADHTCLRNLTQDLDPRLRPVGHSKLSRSLILTEKQSMERSVIERLAKVKDILISYNLLMNRKMEEIFLLLTHYCTGPDRNNTHIGMPSTTATDGVSLSKSVVEVIDNFFLEANVVGVPSDGGGNLWVCREALESKYSNDSVFHHLSPSSIWSALHIY